MKWLTLLFLLTTTEACSVLILTGGGSWGAWEAGVISRLHENGSRYDYITGVSVGSLNAVAYSAMSDQPDVSQKLYEIWSNLKTRNVYELSLKGDSIMSIRPLIETLSNIIQRYQLLDLRHTIYVGMTSFTDGIFTEKVLPVSVQKSINYVIASASIPIFFPLRQVDGEFYFDGGLLHNLIDTSAITNCLLQTRDVTIDVISLRGPIPKFPLSEDCDLFCYIKRTLEILYRNVGDVDGKCDPTTKLTARRFAPKQALEPGFLDFDSGDKLFKEGREATYETIHVC
jgi:hypothetical protein